MKSKNLIKPIKKIKKRKLRNNFDSPWKDALNIFFQDFIFFCFPKMAEEIDWKKGYTFLDKELHSITKDAETGSRTVDKLVKVFKRAGSEIWLLIHVEVQNKKDNDFPQRMYTYQYRLFDRYQVPVASIAVLTDANQQWAPDVYHTSIFDTELNFKYKVLKVLSYQTQKEALAKSSNPFATILLAQLETMALTKEKEGKQHLVSKVRLTRLLYEKGWTRDQVCHLFRFIDWMIQLPPELVLEYDQEICKIEESKKMTYITSIERLGIERGKKLGKEIGKELGTKLGKKLGEAAGVRRGKKEATAQFVQNLYSSLKSEKKVAELSKLSLKKVNEILRKKNKAAD